VQTERDFRKKYEEKEPVTRNEAGTVTGREGVYVFRAGTFPWSEKQRGGKRHDIGIKEDETGLGGSV